MRFSSSCFVLDSSLSMTHFISIFLETVLGIFVQLLLCCMTKLPPRLERLPTRESKNLLRFKNSPILCTRRSQKRLHNKEGKAKGRSGLGEKGARNTQGNFTRVIIKMLGSLVESREVRQRRTGAPHQGGARRQRGDGEHSINTMR